MIRPFRAVVQRWWAAQRARRLLREGAAVILDTETTDVAGDVIEVAVIAADTGQVLLDTLVKPCRPIAADAQAVHGITEQMCDTAPTWAEVWPQLQDAVAGRIVIAYNAPFDRGRVSASCQQSRLSEDQWRWECLMRLDATARGTRRWRSLGGGHRALGDVHAARTRLLSIAAGAPA